MGTDGEPSEAVHQRTLDRLSDAVVSVDAGFQYTALNAAAESLFGYDEHELVGTEIWETFPDAAQADTQDQLETALETQQQTSYTHYREADDSWFEARVFPDERGLSIVFAPTAEPSGTESTARQYERLVENLPVAIAQTGGGSDSTFEYVNEAMVDLFDFQSKDAATDYAFTDLCVDSDAGDRICTNLQTTDWDDMQEIQFTTVNGKQFLGAAAAMAETGHEDADCTYIIQDLSERNAYRKKLWELHDATRDMVAASTETQVADVVIRTADRSLGHQMSGVHLYDESVDALSPVSVSEASQNVLDDIPALDEGIAWQAFQTGDVQAYNELQQADQVFNPDTPFQSEVAIPIEDYGVLIASDEETDAFRDEDTTLLQILASNAEVALSQLQTEQTIREREQALARTKDFLTQTARVAQVGGWEVDIETQSVEWTDEVYRIYDRPIGDTPSFEETIEEYHPADRDVIRNAWRRLTTEGSSFDLELRICPTEHTTKWVRAVGLPEYDDDELVAARGIIQDITERKEREQELEQQNERLDEFASVISHDLRSPLSVANGRTALLQEICDAEAREHVDALANSLDRMGTIIEDTLMLARQGDTVGEMRPVDISTLVTDCWGKVTTETATVEVTAPITVNGDPTRLKHVFENLFRNAIEHGGSDVTVTVGRTDGAGFYVEDTGPGIPADERDTVFEVGHSSAPDGTGFGLPIVKRIAEAHGWDVTVTDGADGGARFVFTNVEFISESQSP